LAKIGQEVDISVCLDVPLAGGIHRVTYQLHDPTTGARFGEEMSLEMQVIESSEKETKAAASSPQPPSAVSSAAVSSSTVASSAVATAPVVTPTPAAAVTAPVSTVDSKSKADKGSHAYDGPHAEELARIQAMGPWKDESADGIMELIIRATEQAENVADGVVDWVVHRLVGRQANRSLQRQTSVSGSAIPKRPRANS